MTNTVSVIIPSLGKESHLVRIAESIRSQDFNPALLEVVIVLNGLSDSRCAELKKAIGTCAYSIRVEKIEERSANKARNRGIDLAKNSLLLFLDDDCSLVGRSFLNQHVSAHLRIPTAFGVGGGYALPDSAGFFDRIYNYLQMRWLTLGSLSDGSAQFLLGGNFSVKSSVLAGNNLRFDDGIAYGGSEYEFFVKAHALGLEMCSDMPDVRHHTSETLRSLSRKHFLQGRGAAIIDQKYPGRKAVGGKSITDPSQPALTNVLLLYFNYVFWAGYHAHQKRIHLLFTRILGDTFRAFNFYRYEILKKISGQISDKNRNS